MKIFRVEWVTTSENGEIFENQQDFRSVKKAKEKLAEIIDNGSPNAKLVIGEPYEIGTTRNEPVLSMSIVEKIRMDRDKYWTQYKSEMLKFLKDALVKRPAARFYLKMDFFPIDSIDKYAIQEVHKDSIIQWLKDIGFKTDNRVYYDSDVQCCGDYIRVAI